MKHRTFWAIFILGVLLVSGFAGLLTLAAGAPGSNPARAPASDTHLAPFTSTSPSTLDPIYSHAYQSCTSTPSPFICYTAPITILAGSTIVIFQLTPSPNQAKTLTDSFGDTLVKRVSFVGGTSVYVTVWTVFNSAGGSNYKLIGTVNSSVNWNLAVVDVSGVSASPLEGECGKAGANTTMAYSAVYPAYCQTENDLPNSVIIEGATFQGTLSQTFTPAGATIIDANAVGGPSGLTAYQVFGNSGGYNETINKSQSSSSSYWGMGGVVLKLLDPAPSPLEASAVGLNACVLTWSNYANSSWLLNTTIAYGTTYGTYSAWVSTASTSTSEASITGLSANTTYFFIAWSWTEGSGSGAVNGLYTNVAVCHTLGSPAPIVSNATLSATGVTLTSVTLTWAPPENVTVIWYTVYYGTSYYPTFAGYASSDNPGVVTTDTITGLTLNTTYYFVLDSWTSAGVRGPPSNVVVAHTLGRAPLEVIAPVLTASASGLTSAVLTWSAVTNVTTTNYTLYDSTGYSNPLTAGATNAGNLLYGSLSGLAQNTTYYAQVDSWTSATVRGPYSNIVTFRTLAGPAPIVEPSVLAADSVSLTSITLTWTAPANVTVLNYTLYRGTAYASPLTGTPVSESTVLDTTVTGLAQNTTYFFEVGTWTSATARGPYTNIVPAHTSSSPAPIIAKNFTLSGAAYYDLGVPGQSIVALQWSEPANVTVLNYTLLEAPLGGSWSDYTPSSLGTSTSTSTSMNENDTFLFQIESWTGATERGPTSNVLVVTSPEFASIAPRLSVAGVSLTSIAVTWTAVQNQSVTNYTLVYSTVGPNGPFTGRVSEGSSLSATISSLAPDTTYWLRVWAWDSGTLVLMSNVGPAQTLSPIPPAPVIPVSLTIPQVVVISTFMALIVAGLIAAGTRKKKRNRNGYPMSD